MRRRTLTADRLFRDELKFIKNSILTRSRDVYVHAYVYKWTANFYSDGLRILKCKTNTIS